MPKKTNQKRIDSTDIKMYNKKESFDVSDNACVFLYSNYDYSEQHDLLLNLKNLNLNLNLNLNKLKLEFKHSVKPVLHKY